MPIHIGRLLRVRKVIKHSPSGEGKLRLMVIARCQEKALMRWQSYRAASAAIV